MDRLPLFFDLDRRPVLLVGSGPAADAKRRLIEGAGGVVVQEPSPGVRIAFVALEGETAASAATELKSAGLLVNVVDRPDLCDFIIPAIVDRSPVIVAIGTGGASATLSKALRERLEALLPASLGGLARTIADWRKTVAVRLTDADDRRRFWDRLLAPGAPLDPLQPDARPADAIAAAIEAEVAEADSLVRIELASPDPDDLTLRQLRAMSQADTIFYAADVPSAVLDRARRDAVRIVCDEAPEQLPPGRSVFVAI